MSIAQLKIMQEVITLMVFMPFAVGFMHQPIKLNFLWAGFCLMGAVYFIFRAVLVTQQPRTLVEAETDHPGQQQ
jgi:hypothetical protein